MKQKKDYTFIALLWIVLMFFLSMPFQAQDKKISQLPALSSISGSEYIPCAISGSNYYLTPNQLSIWLAGGGYIPLVGTASAHPLTGTIDYEPSTSGTTAFVSTTKDYYIGNGNIANLSAATTYNYLYFPPSGGGSLLQSVSGGTSSILNLGTGGNSLQLSATSSANNALLEFNFAPNNWTLQYYDGTYVSSLIGQSTNIKILSTYTAFVGLQYPANTHSIVSANTTSLSILDRGMNDVRYLQTSTYSTAVTSANAPLSINTNTISLTIGKGLSVNSNSLIIAPTIDSIGCSTSTFTANVASYSYFHINQLSSNVTIYAQNVGQLKTGQLIEIVIVDDANIRNLTFNAKYSFGGSVPAPTSTTGAGQPLYMLFQKRGTVLECLATNQF
jgi:hypothetical protein